MLAAEAAHMANAVDGTAVFLAEILRKEIHLSRLQQEARHLGYRREVGV